MSMAVIGLLLTMGAHLTFAGGWMPGYEDDGFVRRLEFAQLTDVTLTKAIYEAKKEQCNAPPGSKARSTYSQLVDDYVEQFEKLTGKRFRVPDCDSV